MSFGQHPVLLLSDDHSHMTLPSTAPTLSIHLPHATGAEPPGGVNPDELLKYASADLG
jgi:hypothetical protein